MMDLARGACWGRRQLETGSFVAGVEVVKEGTS